MTISPDPRTVHLDLFDCGRAYGVGDEAAFFAVAEAMGLAGIVSKHRYRSGRPDRWLKIKCWTENALVLIHRDRQRSGAPMALLARQDEDGLRYAAEPSSP